MFKKLSRGAEVVGAILKVRKLNKDLARAVGRTGTGAASGKVSRLDKLKSGIMKHKKSIAAVGLVSGSLAVVAGQQSELIDEDAERLNKRTDTKCDSFGTSNLFKDCIKQCPVTNEDDPCIVHNGCYNKDKNGEPIYKDVYLKDKCLEDLLKENQLIMQN